MVPTDVLSSFGGVLLDMNGTFMFGGDRFGPEQDYEATYRAFGGQGLASEVVRRTITACFESLGVIYEDPKRCDSFPSVLEKLRELAPDLPETELNLLERVIAQHELGRVPDAYALRLKRLAATHRVGVVANILSRKGPWLDEFARAGVLKVFATTVFSSDGRSIKPSRRSIKPSRKLFDRALDALTTPRSEVVFVGDSLRCDIGGAAAAGLATVWIDRRSRGLQAGDPQPTFTITDLLELFDF